MLPLRWGCQELARRENADHKDDMLYLFWPELMDVVSRRASPTRASCKSLVGERRQYFDHWHARRSEMPKVLGTIPEAVEDPILIEIFGLNPGSIKAVQNPDAAKQTVMKGVPAAKGTARGIARVLQSSDELHRLEPGSILVCESTSPNWTPAFGKIAGAVCDGGGMLSHAAIVGREYGVPTVTALGRRHDLDRRRRRDRGGRHHRHGHHPEQGRHHHHIRGHRRRRPRGSRRVTAAPEVPMTAADVGEPDGTSEATTHSCDAVVWIDEVDPQQAIAAGGSKMGRLAELMQSGVQVPQGFAVTVDAYSRHCRESGLDERIDAVIDRLGSSPTDAEVESASAEIRQMFRETPMGADLTASPHRGLRGAVPALRRRQRAGRGALVGDGRGRRRRLVRRDLRHLPRGLGHRAGARRGPQLLGLAVHRARARLPAAQGHQPPRACRSPSGSSS